MNKSIGNNYTMSQATKQQQQTIRLKAVCELLCSYDLKHVYTACVCGWRIIPSQVALTRLIRD